MRNPILVHVLETIADVYHNVHDLGLRQLSVVFLQQVQKCPLTTKFVKNINTIVLRIMPRIYEFYNVWVSAFRQSTP